MVAISYNLFLYTVCCTYNALVTRGNLMTGSIKKSLAKTFSSFRECQEPRDKVKAEFLRDQESSTKHCAHF